MSGSSRVGADLSGHDPAAVAPTVASQYRQGDVLLVAVSAVPDGALPRPRSGRLVLAEGEATGHAHAILERDARLVSDGPDRFLVTPTAARLVHEEHAAIDLPAGAYQVIIQREFVPPLVTERGPGSWRRVAD